MNIIYEAGSGSFGIVNITLNKKTKEILASK